MKSTVRGVALFMIRVCIQPRDSQLPPLSPAMKNEIKKWK